MKTNLVALAAVLGLVLSTAGVGSAHPVQHGPTGGHLLGTGAFGNIEFVGKLRVTDTPELVADVAVSPDGKWAFLANWSNPTDCRLNSEAGGQNSPDAGAWVIDISDLSNPKLAGFIPHHQDSRPGEGMQVVALKTKFFEGNVLVMNNEQCGKNGKGGVSLWDVTNPRKPFKLSEHFGDRGFPSDTNDIHSSFAWQGNDGRAYVVMTDNFETSDVDILDITNPKRPRLIAELNLDARFPQITQPSIGLFVSVFLHDMIVKKIGDKFVMLLSYWDGGYVQLDVTNPANPMLIGDTDYKNPDPELLESTGVELLPEGNGHQNEFTLDNRFFIGTDEDFAPFGATHFKIIGIGPFAGTYPSVPVPGAAAIRILADDLLNGPVVYGGYGCPNSAPIPRPENVPGYLGMVGPDEEKIIVLQRGPTGDPSAPEPACFPGEKAHQAVLAGWDAVLFVQRHESFENPPFCGSGAFVDEIVGVCTNHEAFHKLFNTPPFDPPYPNLAYPDGPPIGGIGNAKIEATAEFDGWGYVHLFSNTLGPGNKFREIDTYAIAEGHDETKAVGFGDLTVHEVATDPQSATHAYLSYYAGGIRSLEIQCSSPTDETTCKLVEVGGYLDPEGNNFWGVEAFVREDPDGQKRTYILGSDRDSGLWIFRRKP